MAGSLVTRVLFGSRDVGSYAEGVQRHLTLVNLAIDHGWAVSDRDLLIISNCWASPDDHHSWAQLADMADDALDYLNDITIRTHRWVWINEELVMEVRP